MDNENDEDETNIVHGTNVPTLSSIARKVARNEGKQLDEKQYIAYEVICCTFLLDLINEGGDNNSNLYARLQQAISTDNDDCSMKELIKELKIRGAQDQLLMFLTGPAGAGKSAASKVAWRFCFEFCYTVGELWSDSTFLFTAYTGCAAMAVGGFTICKAAFLLSKKSLSEQDKRMWQEVRILMIDEISFMSDKQLHDLERRLKEMRDKNKPFGGYSMIFAGDVCQFQPVEAKDNNLLFSRESSNLWENSINVIFNLGQ